MIFRTADKKEPKDPRTAQVRWMLTAWPLDPSGLPEKRPGTERVKSQFDAILEQVTHDPERWDSQD
jgi:hypothetical protein